MSGWLLLALSGCTTKSALTFPPTEATEGSWVRPEEDIPQDADADCGGGEVLSTCLYGPTASPAVVLPADTSLEASSYACQVNPVDATVWFHADTFDGASITANGSPPATGDSGDAAWVEWQDAEGQVDTRAHGFRVSTALSMEAITAGSVADNRSSVYLSLEPVRSGSTRVAVTQCQAREDTPCSHDYCDIRVYGRYIGDGADADAEEDDLLAQPWSTERDVAPGYMSLAYVFAHDLLHSLGVGHVTDGAHPTSLMVDSLPTGVDFDGLATVDHEVLEYIYGPP